MRAVLQSRRAYLVGFIVLASMAVHRSSPAQAERRGTAVAIVAGVFEYDLSGTGSSTFGAARVEFPLASFVVLEPGLTFARYDAQFGDKVSLFFPEIQLQLQGRSRLSPYLGIGAGPAFARSGGVSDTELSLSGALGLRLRAQSGWGVRGELRIRAIDPFAGTTVEWGLGVSRRL